MVKVLVGVAVGAFVGAGLVVGDAKAFFGTIGWEEVTPIEYQVETNRRDVRVYEFQSKLNPNVGILMGFSDAGPMMQSFTIDPEYAAKVMKSHADK